MSKQHVPNARGGGEDLAARRRSPFPAMAGWALLFGAAFLAAGFAWDTAAFRADGVDKATDAVTYIAPYLIVRIARRGARRERLDALGGLVGSSIAVGCASWVLCDAGFGATGTPSGWLLVGLGALSLCFTLLLKRTLGAAQYDGHAERGARLHVLGDVCMALLEIGAGIVILATGQLIADRFAAGVGASIAICLSLTSVRETLNALAWRAAATAVGLAVEWSPLADWRERPPGALDRIGGIVAGFDQVQRRAPIVESVAIAAALGIEQQSMSGWGAKVAVCVCVCVLVRAAGSWSRKKLALGGLLAGAVACAAAAVAVHLHAPWWLALLLILVPCALTPGADLLVSMRQDQSGEPGVASAAGSRTLRWWALALCAGYLGLATLLTLEAAVAVMMAAMAVLRVVAAGLCWLLPADRSDRTRVSWREVIAVVRAERVTRLVVVSLGITGFLETVFQVYLGIGLAALDDAARSGPLGWVNVGHVTALWVATGFAAGLVTRRLSEHRVKRVLLAGFGVQAAGFAVALLWSEARGLTALVALIAGGLVQACGAAVVTLTASLMARRRQDGRSTARITAGEVLRHAITIALAVPVVIASRLLDRTGVWAVGLGVVVIALAIVALYGPPHARGRRGRW